MKRSESTSEFAVAMSENAEPIMTGRWILHSVSEAIHDQVSAFLDQLVTAEVIDASENADSVARVVADLRDQTNEHVLHVFNDDFQRLLLWAVLGILEDVVFRTLVDLRRRGAPIPSLTALRHQLVVTRAERHARYLGQPPTGREVDLEWTEEMCAHFATIADAVTPHIKAAKKAMARAEYAESWFNDQGLSSVAFLDPLWSDANVQDAFRWIISELSKYPRARSMPPRELAFRCACDAVGMPGFTMNVRELRRIYRRGAASRRRSEADTNR